jgi:serine/threonine-protein kinase RsbW
VSLEVNLSLCLPRDELSVPVVRHICGYALGEVGVVASCVDDIRVALTEACTNVLDHVNEGKAYEVYIDIDDERCTIRVKDAGAGFDFEAARPREQAGADDESGRGLELIGALVDRMQFVSIPDDGMVVHLEKELDFDEAHPVRKRLAGT